MPVYSSFLAQKSTQTIRVNPCNPWEKIKATYLSLLLFSLYNKSVPLHKYANNF